MLAAMIRMIAVGFVTAIGLSACATSAPILWQGNNAYVEDAIAQVPAPTLSGQCVSIIPQGRAETVSVQSDGYRWDGGILVFPPLSVLAITSDALSQAWKLNSTQGSATCQKLYASIQRVRHMIVDLGSFRDCPLVRIDLRLSPNPSMEGSRAKPKTFEGVAAGSIIPFSTPGGSSMVEDYNRTAYLALVRAFSEGLNNIFNRDESAGSAGAHRITCSKRPWY